MKVVKLFRSLPSIKVLMAAILVVFATTPAAAQQMTRTYSGWTQAEEASIERWIEIFHPAIEIFKGQPVSTQETILVQKTDGSAGYDWGQHVLYLNSAIDSVQILHEFTHASDDTNTIALPVFLEGITVALEHEIFAYLGLVHPDWQGTGAGAYPEAFNTLLVANTDWSYGPFRDPRYQAAANAFRVLFQLDPELPRKFFDEYNSRVLGDVYLRDDESRLIDILRQNFSGGAIAGQNFDEFWESQNVLHFSSEGKGQINIFQTDPEHAVVFFKDGFGTETGMASFQLNTRLLKYDGTLIGTRVERANPYGVASISLFNYTDTPPSYFGRVKVEVEGGSAVHQQWWPFIGDDFGLPYQFARGIFGVDTSETLKEGSVAISVAGRDTTVSLHNGAFFAPTLRFARGLTTILVNYADSTSVEWQFVKNIGDHFTYIPEAQSAPEPPTIPDLLTPTDASVVPVNPTFSWQPSERASSYLIQVSRANDFNKLEIEVEVVDTSYQALLEFGAECFWRVQSVCEDGRTSEWSVTRSFTVESQPIWAGDANHDGVVEFEKELDLILSNWGNTGPSRPDGTYQWMPQRRIPWPNGAEDCDVDGNGIIGPWDVLGVIFNDGNQVSGLYASVKTSKPTSSVQGVAGKLVITGDTNIRAGQQFSVSVRVDSTEFVAMSFDVVFSRPDILTLQEVRCDGLLGSPDSTRFFSRIDSTTGSISVSYGLPAGSKNRLVNGCLATFIFTSDSTISSDAEVLFSLEKVLALDQSAMPFTIPTEGATVTLTTTLTAIGDQPHLDIPSAFALQQNYPNPFNPATTIEFSIPKPTQVKLQIFNALGQVVTTLVDEVLPPGSHSRTLVASELPSGVYYFRLQAGEFVQTRKMLLLR